VRFVTPPGYERLSDTDKIRELVGLVQGAPERAVVERLEQIVTERTMWQTLVLRLVESARDVLDDHGLDLLTRPIDDRKRVV